MTQPTQAEIRVHLEVNRAASAGRLQAIVKQINAAGGRYAASEAAKAARESDRELREEHRRLSRTPQSVTIRKEQDRLAEESRARVSNTKIAAELVARLVREEAEIMNRCGFAGEPNPYETEV